MGMKKVGVCMLGYLGGGGESGDICRSILS